MPARFAALLALLLAACSQPSEASDVAQRPDGPVLDEGDVFPAEQEAALERDLTDYFNETGVALVVVTDSALDGETIEKVAFDTFNEWGIGDEETGRGLLVLVAPAERQIRIEVGCGLETVVTDLRASRVIGDTMIPLYRSGDLAGATIAGVDELKRVAVGPAITDAPHSPLCLESALS